MPIYRVAATVELEVFVEHEGDDEAMEAVERILEAGRASGVVPGSVRIEGVDELDPEDLPADTRIVTFIPEAFHVDP